MHSAIRRWTGLLLLAVLLAFGHRAATARQEAGPRIVGYYTAWSIYDRGYLVSDIPADRLTHINYAFANLSDEGECILGDAWADTEFAYPGLDANAPFRGNFGALRQLKQQHPHLNVLLSVGGWTWSTHFSDAALTPESRDRFARSCVALMTQYGFDGLDIDWEFPVEGGLDDGRPADKRNFTLLLARLRYQLDQQGLRDDRHYLLTIAAPQSIQFYENMELSRIHEHLDWLNLMTYTYNGGWSEATNHHAPLFASAADPSEYRADFNVDATVRAYLAAGVPPEKLVIGLPFYGHGWSGVENVNHGLFQPFEGLPEATWGDGIYDYADLSANYVGVFIRFWYPSAQVPWLYSASDQIMISYDDPTSLRAKADYVRAHTLGGVMIWELAYDDDTHTLLDAVYRRLTAP